MFLDCSEFPISIRVKLAIQYLANYNEMEKWICPISFMCWLYMKVTTDVFIQISFSIIL